jgi:hypothetical protein
MSEIFEYARSGAFCFGRKVAVQVYDQEASSRCVRGNAALQDLIAEIISDEIIRDEIIRDEIIRDEIIRDEIIRDEISKPVYATLD